VVHTRKLHQSWDIALDTNLELTVCMTPTHQLK